MNWNAAVRTACLLALTGGAFWGGTGATRHIIAAFDAWGSAAPDVGPTLGAVNATLAAINGPRGTLHDVDKAIVKAGDAVVTTQMVEQASAAKIDTTMDALATIPAHANLTADAGAAAFSQAAVDLTSLNTSIEATTPLLLNAGNAVEDVDTFIKENSPVVHQIGVNVTGMTNSGDLMLVDAQWKTHQLLHPDKVKLGFWGALKVTEAYIHAIEPPIF